MAFYLRKWWTGSWQTTFNKSGGCLQDVSISLSALIALERLNYNSHECRDGYTDVTYKTEVVPLLIFVTSAALGNDIPYCFPARFEAHWCRRYGAKLSIAWQTSKTESLTALNRRWQTFSEHADMLWKITRCNFGLSVLCTAPMHQSRLCSYFWGVPR